MVLGKIRPRKTKGLLYAIEAVGLVPDFNTPLAAPANEITAPSIANSLSSGFVLSPSEICHPRRARTSCAAALADSVSPSSSSWQKSSKQFVLNSMNPVTELTAPNGSATTSKNCTSPLAGLRTASINARQDDELSCLYVAFEV